MKKGVLVLISVVAMMACLGLVACGGSQASSKSASSTAASSASTASKSASASASTAASSSAAAASSAASAPASSTAAPSTANYIGDQAAIDIALKDAGFAASDVTELKCELDRDDAVVHYDVDFKNGGKEYDYDIGATDGKILSAKSEVDN